MDTTSIRHGINPLIGALLIFIFIFSSIAITTIFLYQRAQFAQKGEIREGLQRSAKIIAETLVDPELHKTFIYPSQRLSSEYQNAVKPFVTIVKNDPSLKYVFTVVLKNNAPHFVLVSGDPTDPNHVDIMQEYTNPSPEMLEALQEQKIVVSKEPHSDPWGTFFFAFAPFYDKNHNFVGVVGINFVVDTYMARLKPIKLATLRSLKTGMLLSILIALSTWFALRFTAEINKIRMQLMENLRISVVTDGLTGLFNRRYFDLQYRKLFNQASESSNPLVIMMTDIDFFKHVNDTYGHVVGDELLQQISRRLSQNVRLTDMVARYGGEEFVVTLPGTDLPTALRVAERIRHSIEAKPFIISAGNGTLEKTISIGIAIFKEDDSLEGLLKRADAGLYLAKEGGRNQVGIAEAA